MKVDKKLNFVVPLVDENDRPYAYVHSTPISADTFDTYFLPLARTYSAIFALGLGPVAGPRVADKMLRQSAIDLKMWEGPTGVQAGLFAEIHRLTNVIYIGKNGWEWVPYDFALKNDILSVDDASEVEAALCFFSVTSAVHPKQKLAEYLEAASLLWDSQTTSLNSTEFTNFLPTSTAAASSGGTGAA